MTTCHRVAHPPESRLSFSEKRPPLPGQQHPASACARRSWTSSFTSPHPAQGRPARLSRLFPQCHPFFPLFQLSQPRQAGRDPGIEKTFPKIPFKHLAWIVYLNCLRMKTARLRMEGRGAGISSPQGAQGLPRLPEIQEAGSAGRKGTPLHDRLDGYERKLDELIKIKLMDRNERNKGH